MSAGGAGVVAGSFIDGKTVTTAGRLFEIRSPATGVVVAELTDEQLQYVVQMIASFFRKR